MSSIDISPLACERPTIRFVPFAFAGQFRDLDGLSHLQDNEGAAVTRARQGDKDS
jgi:hypothetical protein